LFSVVLRERVRLGMWTGCVAAAATAGALVGFGRARGAPAGPLNAVAHMVIGTRALVIEGFDVAVTTLGLTLHAVVILIWGVLFALVAARLRGTRLLLAATLFTAAVFVFDYYIVPPQLRPGFESVLSPSEVAVVYAVLALALALGLGLHRRTAGVA
jgi:hypothetical protein